MMRSVPPLMAGGASVAVCVAPTWGVVGEPNPAGKAMPGAAALPLVTPPPHIPAAPVIDDGPAAGHAGARRLDSVLGRASGGDGADEEKRASDESGHTVLPQSFVSNQRATR